MDGQAGRLAGKVALITGAASGIGRATAGLFRAQGAKVAATDRNEAGLKTLGADADLTLSQDVTDEARWRAVVDEVLAKFGRFDILVNSAGIAVLGNIETTTIADWRKVHAVNADGVFLGCREAVRAMKETGGGSIVNLSSLAAFLGTPNLSAYGASKGAVRQFTKTVAIDCARKGYKVRCNSVHPGVILTPMGEGILSSATARERTRKSIPIGDFGAPEDIAYGILYLISDESRFVTGAELVIDGGMNAI